MFFIIYIYIYIFKNICIHIYINIYIIFYSLKFLKVLTVSFISSKKFIYIYIMFNT